jgi:alkylation response protein AidB-like acyl-CoA dehydrogenase
VLAVEEVAYGDVGVATSTFLLELAAGPLMHFGTPEQKRRWLQPLTEQLRFASYGWTEPQGSSNLFGQPAATVATPVEGGFELTGLKSTISNAHVASLFTIFARLEGGPDGLTCFVLPRESPGLSTRAPYRKMGQRAADTGEITLDRVFVSQDQLLGRPGQGAHIAVRAIKASRVGVCAMAVGVARRARDLVIQHGHARITSDGRRLIQQQDYRFRVAELEAAIETVRSLCWRASHEVEHGPESTKLSSTAKLVGAEMAVKWTSQAIEMLGAQGYLESGLAEKLYRDAKALQIYEGPPAIQKMIIADTATRPSRVGR